MVMMARPVMLIMLVMMVMVMVVMMMVLMNGHHDDGHGDDKADYYDDNLDVSDDRLQQRSHFATCKTHAHPASAQRSQAATAAND